MKPAFKIHYGRQGFAKKLTKVPTHLQLSDEQKDRLQNLITIGDPDIQKIHEFNDINEGQIFMRQHGLDLPQSNPKCKWATRHCSNTTVVRHCLSGSNHQAHHQTKGTHLSTGRYLFTT